MQQAAPPEGCIFVSKMQQHCAEGSLGADMKEYILERTRSNIPIITRRQPYICCVSIQLSIAQRRDC
jgi:hypothetical protein